jgi:G8 domain
MLRKACLYVPTLAILVLTFSAAPSPHAAQATAASFAAATLRSNGSRAVAADPEPTPTPTPSACIRPTGTPLDKCKDKDGNVVIGSGATTCTGVVVVDKKNIKVGKITINSGGKLVIDDTTAAKLKQLEIETDGIDINGGSLLIGDKDCPIGTTDPKATVTILFIGPKPGADVCGTPNNLPTSNCPGWQKGIQVEKGGTLRMYGLKGVVPRGGISWTYLAKPAGPSKYNPNKKGGYVGNVLAPVNDAPDVIHLAADVTAGAAAWRPDDWIAIATTSFSPWETEFVKIHKVEKEGNGSKITLDQHLHYYHFGGPDPGLPSDANYTAGAGLNYGVDERAEVGLISRNILLTSDTDTAHENKKNDSEHWGGEIRIINGFTAVSIQGVELQKFGKEQLGSYPIHFHKDGSLANYPAADKLVDSNSVDHSYNKCITIHSTQDVTLSNNVCARITGHIFYEELGDESNITFTSNLGLGAMSNSFDVNGADAGARQRLIKDYYWVGDNMADSTGALAPMGPGNIGFRQFKIFDTDDQTNPVHGACGSISVFGKINLDQNSQLPDCSPPNVYFEPPSGFWLTNPSTKLVGNAIAGCQDDGRAYWYVPPGSPVNGVDAQFIPIGSQYSTNDPDKYGLFENNRASACYAGIYDEQDVLNGPGQLFGYQDGIHDANHQAVVDEFDGVTLSRIRDRGIWIRPTFYVVKDARIATTRDGVSLVTSGGVDGNYPGVWGLLTHSTIVGMSQNNVDRWGPCGEKINAKSGVQVRGAEWGCIDQTNPHNEGNCCERVGPKHIRQCTIGQKVCNATDGGEFTERGYPSPDWPMFGFLIYDGPPLILHDRFVNFRVAPGSEAAEGFEAANLLTGDDDDILKKWHFYALPSKPPYTKYEGDAALGWFNANQSSYPAASTTEQLTFTNVDLRHQVYTAQVNRGDFTDGDENTTILDLDGTLAGVLAVDKVTGDPLPSISLNNLGMNASANSVDECLAEGAEDNQLEGRPTAAMVPSALGQLEFEMLYPPYTDTHAFGHTETVTFAKDSPDFTSLGGSFTNYHGSMALKSRNGLGDWEPKVTNGYGYTVTASTYTAPDGTVAPPSPTLPGISSIVDITLTDIVNDPEIGTDHPFYIQLAICYTNADGKTHPADKFDIKRGYRSYAKNGGNVVPNDKLKPYWSPLACDSLDSQQVPNKSNDVPLACPTASATGSPVVDLSANEVKTIQEMTTDGKLNGPPNLDKYYYDSTNGWLFLWVRQNEANAKGPSPLGNCTGDSNDPAYCPSKTTGESYYVCPAEGCTSYRIVVKDPNYAPGPSNCGDPYSAAQGYSWPGGPPNQNTLVVAGSSPVVPVDQDPQGGLNNKFPHYASKTTLTCNPTTP